MAPVLRPARGGRRHTAAALSIGIAFLCGLVSARPAAAQEAGSSQWQFSLTPYLWIAGVGGTISTPNPKIPSQNVSASFGDVLSHLNAIPIMGAGELRYGRFGVLADIMVISVKANVSTNNVLFTGGSAKLTQVIGTALATYRVMEAAGQFLDLGVGVRAFGMSANFSVNPGLLPGFSIGRGASWADPIGGIRYHVNLSPKWGLTAYGDIGGGPSSSMTWQLFGTVDYRITNSTTMRLGYRHLQFQHYGNALHQNMSMSGPILGATIQF